MEIVNRKAVVVKQKCKCSVTAYFDGDTEKRRIKECVKYLESKDCKYCMSVDKHLNEVLTSHMYGGYGILLVD